MSEKNPAADGAVSACTNALTVGGSLQIQDVEAMRERLRRLFDGLGPLCIDVGDLLAVDTAGVQLLVALRLDAARRGRELYFRGESPRLDQALDLLGLRGAVYGAERHGA